MSAPIPPGQSPRPIVRLRWRGRDAAVSERDFENLVRAGLVPQDAWVISPRWTNGHALLAGDMEVYHLWCPDPDDVQQPPPRPPILGEIYLHRRLSVTLGLIVANVLVAVWLIVRWGNAYPQLQRAWATDLKAA